MLFPARAGLTFFVFTPAGTAGFFECLGLPGVLAKLAIPAETRGGVALIAGICARVVPVALGPVPIGAIVTVHGSTGCCLDNEDGGCLYPAFWLVALIVSGTGPVPCIRRASPAEPKGKTMTPTMTGNAATAGVTSAGAPLRIGSVTLTVRDLAAMTRFYRDAIGLAVIAEEPSLACLGVGDDVLIVLRHDPAARLADPRQAGLFHVAFLLPDRAALAHWLRHAARNGVRMQGASDHLVSEALYLSDPEGNGIEIYRDRPSEDWTWQDGTVAMATRRLDLEALAVDAPAEVRGGLPAGTIVGHVHLQVGDRAAADAFYVGLLGLDIVHRMSGASFYSTGGYHHHIAANTWNSDGAGPRPAGTTGLTSFELVPADADIRAVFVERMGAQAVTDGSGAVSLTDPWGTRLSLRAV